MGFCNVADIQFLTRVTYSTETEPTLSQVENWIDIIADEIEHALTERGITIPSSSDKFYSVLKKYNAIGVAGLILSGNQAEIAEGISNYWDDYKKFINDVNEGKLDNFATSSVSSNNVTDGYTKSSDIKYNDWDNDFNY